MIIDLIAEYRTEIIVVSTATIFISLFAVFLNDKLKDWSAHKEEKRNETQINELHGTIRLKLRGYKDHYKEQQPNVTVKEIPLWAAERIWYKQEQEQE